MNPTQPTPGATAEACALSAAKDIARQIKTETTYNDARNTTNAAPEIKSVRVVLPDVPAIITRHFAPLLARVAELEKERDDAIRDSDEYAAQAERERDQRQREVGSQEYRGNTVSYMYDKAKCYGDMVHGCSPALAAAGFPPDEFAKDGQVGAIARAVTAMAKQLAAAKGAVAVAIKLANAYEDTNKSGDALIQQGDLINALLHDLLKQAKACAAAGLNTEESK